MTSGTLSSHSIPPGSQRMATTQCGSSGSVSLLKQQPAACTPEAIPYQFNRLPSFKPESMERCSLDMFRTMARKGDTHERNLWYSGAAFDCGATRWGRGGSGGDDSLVLLGRD